MNVFEFLKNDLAHVLPILIMGAFGIAIILERIKALYQNYPTPNLDSFIKQISSFTMTGKMNDAVVLCDQYSTSLIPKVIKTALARAHMPETVIEDGLQIAVSHATQAIQKRTSFLATIANVATLLGLFGTILGLIHSFEAVGHADAQQKSALLSAGISTAMNSTMLGLAVAIPSMLAYSFLVNRSNTLIAEVENSALKIMDILKQRFYAVDKNEEGQGRSL